MKLIVQILFLFSFIVVSWGMSLHVNLYPDPRCEGRAIEGQFVNHYYYNNSGKVENVFFKIKRYMDVM